MFLLGPHECVLCGPGLGRNRFDSPVTTGLGSVAVWLHSSFFWLRPACSPFDVGSSGCIRLVRRMDGKVPSSLKTPGIDIEFLGR